MRPSTRAAAVSQTTIAPTSLPSSCRVDGEAGRQAGLVQRRPLVARSGRCRAAGSTSARPSLATSSSAAKRLDVHGPRQRRAAARTPGARPAGRSRPPRRQSPVRPRAARPGGGRRSPRPPRVVQGEHRVHQVARGRTRGRGSTALRLEERLDAVVETRRARTAPAPTSTPNQTSSRFSAFMRSCTAMTPSVSARPAAAMTTAVRCGRAMAAKITRTRYARGDGVAGHDQVHVRG